jgi:hypothetical protein
MKVSVFNDDRKTELIGEIWVDLQEVIVPGGGKNNLWHHLNFQGKYAGEILIEITFYDKRPKQEKASENMRQSVPNGVTDEALHAMARPGKTRRRLKPGNYQHLNVTGPTNVVYCYLCDFEWYTVTPSDLVCPSCGDQITSIVSHNLEVASLN